ncbi:MAG: glycine cleavage system regulatory protein [Lentisphaeria bacterium]|jgi:glycine cleavage system regulatory protein
MFSHLILTVISDDKPGVVEAIANVVSKHEGNWLESRLAQLAGKFAGVIRVTVPEEQKDALIVQMAALQNRDIGVTVDTYRETPHVTPHKQASFHAVGPDRLGIVWELSQAFARSQINLAELETKLSSMAYSGEPLFEACGQLEIPIDIDLQSIHDTLDTIADALALDISLNEKE